jgi:hypothetical protein
MEWISTKERMPAKDSWVIVIRNDTSPHVAFFTATNKCYFFCIGSDVEQTWEPEYWLPLPNQPERSKREDHD